jgi:hypothetical protein
MTIYKEVKKETALILCDNVLTYPSYLKILDWYREEIGKVCESLKMPEQVEEYYEEYYAACNKLGAEYNSKLEELVNESLEKFEMPAEIIQDYFRAVVGLTNEQITSQYKNTDERTNEPTHIHRVMDFQMAYLSGMIQKLNPEKIEFEIPEGIVYEGQVGYNLSFDGEFSIKGSMRLFGRNLRKAKVHLSGCFEELSIHSKEIDVTLDGRLNKLNITDAGKVRINTDVAEASIRGVYESIEINGSVSRELSYYPAEGQKPILIQGNARLYNCESPEDLYKIIKNLDVKGRLTVL